MISQVEVDGLPKAQKDLLEYKNKTRPPFPALYELYSGSCNQRRYWNTQPMGPPMKQTAARAPFMHLYVGLWYTVNRDKANAIEQLEKAVATLRSTDYMWYVSAVPPPAAKR